MAAEAELVKAVGGLLGGLLFSGMHVVPTARGSAAGGRCASALRAAGAPDQEVEDIGPDIVPSSPCGLLGALP